MKTAKTSARCTLFLLLCVGAIPHPALSQRNLTIAGTVIDGVSGMPVVDANIVIVGTAIGASSDSSGRFVIRRVPPLWHVLKIMRIGYKQAYRSVAISTQRDTTILDVILYPTAVVMPGVTATAESQNHQIERELALSFISADKIIEGGATFTDDVLSKHAQYLTMNSYDLFVNGAPFPAELVRSIDVHEVKEIFVWNWIDAPIDSVLDYVSCIRRRDASPAPLHLLLSYPPLIQTHALGTSSSSGREET